MSEHYTVGPLLEANSDKDITCSNEETAFSLMEKMSNENENILIGLYECDGEYATYVAINGETFHAL